MPDQSDAWRRALELLAHTPEGVTDAALLANGFAATTIIRLVKSGLATSVTEHVWCDRFVPDYAHKRMEVTPIGRRFFDHFLFGTNPSIAR